MKLFAKVKGTDKKLEVESISYADKIVLVECEQEVQDLTSLDYYFEEVQYTTKCYDFDEVELFVSGDTSDSYHTFDELYYHRMILFSVICNQNKELAWKSKQHHDGSMFKDHFIVGIDTPEGQFTYHYHLDHWNYFDVRALLFAPDWDFHTSDDVIRLLSLKTL